MKREIANRIKLLLLLNNGQQHQGWIIVGVSILLCNLAFGKIDLSFFHFWGETTKTMGTVIERIDISSSTIETSYKFKAKDNFEYRDFSYGPLTYPSNRKDVRVEYPKGKPELARIIGQRREEHGLNVLLWYLIPSFGFFLIFAGIHKGKDNIDFLQQGTITTARYKKKTKTTKAIGDEVISVINQLYTFKAEKNIKYTITKTTPEDKMADTIEKKELIIYNPKSPSECAFLHTLPAELKMIEPKEIIATRNAYIGAFIFPIIFGLPHLIHTIIKCLNI